MARRYDQNAEKLTPAMKVIFERKSALFAQNIRLLEANSFTKVLERGFVLVKDNQGKAVKSALQATSGMGVDLVFHDGERHANITDGGVGSSLAKPKKPKSPPQKKNNGQEELF